MSDTLLRLYHGLPTPLRSAAATLRGYYLRSWRYGPETDRLVEAALEREHWTPERWQAWQHDRLAYILHRAVTHVRHYREHWAERRRRGDEAPWQDLNNWPVLEKESVRSDPRAFVADDCRPERMFHEHTSGTTGKSLDLWKSKETVRSLFALAEARERLGYGASRHDNWAILGGQLVKPVSERRPPFWVWNAALNQLYMSSYHLAPDLVPYYIAALQQYQIRFLWGYTSSLYALAEYALRVGIPTLRLKVAITNAEPLYEYQRQSIAKAFGCPVRETYGMAEHVALAAECSAGRLHISPEVGLIQVMDGDRLVPRGTTGELVCTGLLNPDMPLIRYRVGDRGALPAAHRDCDCGRTLPTIESIEGRTDDIVFTADGRAVGRLDLNFKSVHEAQVEQEALCRFRVRYVPAPGFTPEVCRSIVERLQGRLGAVEVTLEEVSEVPRTARGKFRTVVCSLPEAQKNALLRQSIVHPSESSLP